MKLQDLTHQQLRRVYNKLYSQLSSGGLYGWDWHTLHATYPSKCAAMRAVAQEHDHKVRLSRVH